MRPIKLEIEGFTSFRDRTVVDFEDTDLFVLTGATGSGKSSVIDAMTFALYGSIPRLDNRNLVAPVMSRGLLRTLVRLDFAVGQRHYTAVRELRANRSGVSTSEARLEDDLGNTLAANENELSAEVEALLGIPFEHFIKCVVLPQGDFADFIHARAADRQRFLIDLLGLDLFDQVGQKASQRKSGAEGQITALRGQVSRLDEAGHSESSLKQARARFKAVKKAQESIVQQQPVLEKLRERDRSATSRAEGAAANEEKLKAIAKPDEVERLAETLRETLEAVQTCREKVNQATKARQTAQEELESLPNEVETRTLIQSRQDLATRAKAKKAAVGRIKDRAGKVAEARKMLSITELAVAEADAERQRTMKAHLSYHLADGLESGQLCPVCLRKIEDLPDHEIPAEESVAQEALSAAEDEHKKCALVLQDAEQQLAVEKDRAGQISEAIQNLSAELSEAKFEEDLKKDLEAIEAAKNKLSELNHAERTEQKKLGAREHAQAKLAKTSEDAWAAYESIRDRVAELLPPAPNRDDLSVAWEELLAWAKEASSAQNTLKEIAVKEQEEIRVEKAAILKAIETTCAEIDLEIGDGDAPSHVAAELGRLEMLVGQIEKALSDLKAMGEEADSLEKEAQVAAELSRLLNATNFKRWLMRRVLGQLSDTASDILLDLSSGAYSLAVDGRSNFLVIDHRNANEQRPIRTLSGGETFLASLSLALSLSEHLAEMAVAGSAKLEALFLDEGFGTLDTDTLDVVTTAIEELGARGRMIGIVTHVNDLAERIPVRYEVSKEGNRSSIVRIAS